MSFSDLANLADVLAALGVIASLLFVGIEIRKNTSQTRLSNWQTVIGGFRDQWSRTHDRELADLLSKGRRSYRDLTDGEKITFGHYLEELCLTYETMAELAGKQIREPGTVRDMYQRHMQFHFGFPGTREWLDEFESQRGFPPEMSSRIHEALDGR